MNNKVDNNGNYSRTKNVSQNVAWVIVSQIVTILLNLVSRKIFLHILGFELLGANSLFTDVMSLFSLADLGFGTAVVFALYKPIAENDVDKVKSLLRDYRTIYRYVIILLIVISIAFAPFLSLLNTSIPLKQFTFYYFINQVNCIIGYICAYRETYVAACQKQRTITKFGIVFTIIQILLQIMAVKMTANFSVYLCVALSLTAIRKVIVNLYIIKNYPETIVKDASILPREERKNVFCSAKAVLVHRLGNLAINQTDSLIVSTFINMAEWGRMSNYLVLKMAVSGLLDNIYSAILPSVGNLVAKENESKQIKFFNTYDFMNFWLYLFCYISLGTLSSQFIRLYFGDKCVLDELTVFAFFTAFFWDGLRTPVSAMREANGAFRTDQWYTILAAFVNLVVSISLVQSLGLKGVYFGTCCAMLVLHVSRSILLFKRWENVNAYIYLFRILKYLLLGIAIYKLTALVQLFLCGYIENALVCFLISGVCAVVIPNLIVIVLYIKSECFNDTIVLLRTKLLRL